MKPKLYSFNPLGISTAEKEKFAEKAKIKKPQNYSSTLKLRQKYKFWPFVPNTYNNFPIPPALTSFKGPAIDESKLLALKVHKVESSKLYIEEDDEYFPKSVNKTKDKNINFMYDSNFSSNYESTMRRRATRKRVTVHFKQKEIKPITPDTREFFSMASVTYKNYKYPKTDCLLVKRKRFTNILLDKMLSQPLHSNIEACMEHMKEKEDISERHYEIPEYFETENDKEGTSNKPNSLNKAAKTHQGFNVNSKGKAIEGDTQTQFQNLQTTPFKISIPPRTSTTTKRHNEAQWIFSKISNTKEVIISKEFERLSELSGIDGVLFDVLRNENEIFKKMDPTILNRVFLALGFNPKPDLKLNSSQFSKVLKFTILRKVTVRELLDFLLKFFTLGESQLLKENFLRILRILSENFEEDDDLAIEENFYLTEVLRPTSDFVDLDKFRAAFLSLQMNPHDIYELIFSPCH